MKLRYRIGYIDEDEKQVKKYRRRFRKYGFDVIGYEFRKGMTLEELMRQVYQSDIDLLMIDYKLDESNKVTFNGEEVESEIYDKKPQFPHIIFTNKKDDAIPYVEDLKIIFSKDHFFNDESEEDKNKTSNFIEMLERSIRQYKKHLNRKKKIVEELLLKAENSELNAQEKHILLKNQREIQDLDRTSPSEVPEHLVSLDKLENLSNTRKEAEAFLQSLIERSRKK